MKYIIGFTCALVMLIPSFAHAVQIEPTRQAVTIDPGAQQVFRLTVTNDGDSEEVLVPEIDSFIIDEATGGALFGQDSIAEDWVRFDQNAFALQPGETKVIPFTIVVPEGTTPGTHYLGAFVKQRSDDAMITVGARVGSLVFVYTGGVLNESVVRETFAFDHGFSFSGKNTADFTIRNVGDVHVVPQGSLVLLNRKNEVLYRELLNPSQQKVLPGATWSTAVEAEKLKNADIGPVRARIEIRYGETDQVLAASATYWFIPPVSIGMFAGLVIVFFITSHIIAEKKQS